MFRALGWIVARGWLWLLLAWVLVFVAAMYFAPDWMSVAKEGEFGFLPDRMPSRIGEKLFDQAFPDEVLASSVVLIVRRNAAPYELTDGDRQFVNETLVTRLRDTAGQAAASGSETEPENVAAKTSLISRVRSPSDDLTGPLLASTDDRAMLVIVELQTDFLDLRNGPVVSQIERLLEDVKRDSSCPPGLEIHVSGRATVGRDLSAARASSADATKMMTVVLVVVLLVLILIYRVPLPALIPLLTVFVSVELSLKLLSILAKYGMVGLFDGVQTYITVIVYGAGVAISFSLCIVLLAALTLSSSVLRLAGRWAFWPRRIDAAVGTRDEPRSRWDRVGELLLKRPGSVLGVSFVVMLPLCVVAALSRTGWIISSCGVIMAGTFSALMFGSLVGLRQLGFALAFGLLLDTFLVRPILVPAFLILLHRHRSAESEQAAALAPCDLH